MKHLLCEIRGPIEDSELVAEALSEACWRANASIIDSVQHRFEPQGFTMLILLAESHASVHTWPEQGMAMVDYFSCADDPKIEVFVAVLESFGFRILNPRLIERERMKDARGKRWKSSGL